MEPPALRLGTVLALLAGLAPGGAAAWDPPARPGHETAKIHACVRLPGLSDPLEVASRLAALAPAARRERLVAVLRSEAQEAAAPFVARLRGTQPELLWGAGVVCAWAPRAVFEGIAASGAEVIDDPPRIDAEIDDSSGPNQSVPPEPPLVSLHVPEAWDRGFTGESVVVALIDTGIDLTHPDLAGQVWTNPGEIPNNGIDDDGNGYIDDVHGWNFSGNNNDVSDQSGHGTDTAGLLAGNGASGSQTGAAPDVRIMVLRRGTTESAMWAAAQYAVANGAQVISQSSSWRWSFSPRPDYPSWRRQAATELAAGVIHVNSAGNNGTSLDTDPVPYNVSAPANCPPPWIPPDQSPAGGVSSIVAAGNVDAKSLLIVDNSSYGPAEWTDIRAHRDPSYPYTMPPEFQDYPDWGGATGLLKPDLVAPGDNSLTTRLGGGYETFGGTSASAPRLAAILALMRQAVPTAAPADLYRAREQTARDLGTGGRDVRYGAGIADANAAIDAAKPPTARTARTSASTSSRVL